jgi:hypothetical protein
MEPSDSLGTNTLTREFYAKVLQQKPLPGHVYVGRVSSEDPVVILSMSRFIATCYRRKWFTDGEIADLMAGGEGVSAAILRFPDRAEAILFWPAKTS